MERTGVITMKGNPLTLVGAALKVDDVAPDFTLLDKTLSPVTLDSLGLKVKIISVTPSLDTPVCDLQAKRFNEEAAALGDEVTVLNVSMDLPFALGRFCAANDIEGVVPLSDHRDASFGEAWGVLIKELRLLTRAIFVLDRTNVIHYIEIVPEVTDSPDFDTALAEAKKLI